MKTVKLTKEQWQYVVNNLYAGKELGKEVERNAESFESVQFVVQFVETILSEIAKQAGVLQSLDIRSRSKK